MHSLIGLDENKELLTNSLTWADNRAKNVVKKAKADGLAQKIYQQTGMPKATPDPKLKFLNLKARYLQPSINLRLVSRLSDKLLKMW